jgi:CDP-diacylglycerol--glycerol-3-phosphate 3-phosphatidyltransferase
MGLANGITLGRILLIPLFMGFLLSNFQPYGVQIAAGIFFIAALTDTVDGYVARTYQQVTQTGQFLDPLADKLLVSAALVSLVGLGVISAWVAMVIIAREFAVTGLRLVAMASYQRVVKSSSFGKIKTISQTVAITVLILNPPIFFAGRSLGWYLMAVAVILTIFSGIEYFFRYSSEIDKVLTRAS